MICFKNPRRLLSFFSVRLLCPTRYRAEKNVLSLKRNSRKCCSLGYGEKKTLTIRQLLNYLRFLCFLKQTHYLKRETSLRKKIEFHVCTRSFSQPK